jgi:formylglycine-generating enzyme required for sulfatase activity
VDFELVRLGEFLSTRRVPARPAVVNAPTYFAPEFAEGAAASAASDVYAMGLCLYEFLAGEPPYRAGGSTEAQITISILLQHLTKPLPDLRQFRRDVPEGLLAVLQQATAKHPLDRYQNANEFAAALQPYAGLPPEPAHAPLHALSTESYRSVRPPLNDPQPEEPVESQVIELGWEEPGPQEMPASGNRSPLEITAPQPTPSDVPETEDPAVSHDASAREPLAVKIRYLLLGVLFTLAIIAGTAAGTAYFLRFAVHLPGAPAEPASRPAATGVAAPVAPAATSPGVAAVPGDHANMVLIPTGTFRMGSRDGYADERPDHVESENAFWLDVHEITVGEYDKCVSAGECRRQKTIRQPDAEHKFDRFCNYGRKSREQHPMNCVDWYQARAYCRWVGKRLPTESEWEYAARGTDSRKYPWGNEAPSENLLNACGRECVILGAQVGKRWESMYAADDGWDATAPVGSFPHDKSPFGVLDLAGNVAEWTDSEYAKCYRDDCEANSKERVIRGGAWNDDEPRDVRASYRNRDVPLLRASFVGFRCAQSEAPKSPDPR